MTLENWAVCWDEHHQTRTTQYFGGVYTSSSGRNLTEPLRQSLIPSIRGGCAQRLGSARSSHCCRQPERYGCRVSTCQFTEIVYLHLRSFKMTQSNFCFRVVTITDATLNWTVFSTRCAEASQRKLPLPFCDSRLRDGADSNIDEVGIPTEPWKVNEI